MNYNSEIKLTIVTKIPLWPYFPYIHSSKKCVLLEFVDIAIDPKVMMMKNAEAEAFLLITVLKSVEHNV